MTIQFDSVIPILRIFDVAKADEFYLGFLGFKVDWEHRFGENFPLYVQVSLGDCLLHLTGHHGDCCPGAGMRIEVQGLDAFHQRLIAADYKHAKPGIQLQPWGSRDMSLIDPFGNRLTFFETAETGAAAGPLPGLVV